jgi:copper chaperone
MTYLSRTGQLTLMWAAEKSGCAYTRRGYTLGCPTKALDMRQTIEHLTYFVPGISCEHCRAAMTAEIEKIAGVSGVHVDLDTKRVRVSGSDLDDGDLRAAIDEAGYDVA